MCGDATATIPALQRSDRIRCRPDYYAEGSIIASNSTFDETRSFQEAMSSPIKTQWETAMELEMKSLSDNEVWELIELPKGHKPVGSKCVYKIKSDGDGYIERFKARLVAQGFSQTKGAVTTMKHSHPWFGWNCYEESLVWQYKRSKKFTNWT